MSNATGIMSLDGQSVVWEPLPKQRLAMACPADEVFYGGKKGCAKTDGLIMRPAPLLAAAHREYERTKRQQRCLIVIFRKTMSNETLDMIQRTQDLYPLLDPEMGINGWKDQAKMWKFTSGAKVVFTHLEGPQDHKRWNGVEMVGVAIDQVEEIPFDTYKFLVANNRTTNDALRKEKFFFSTGNPGGAYADWVYEYFVEPNEEGSTILREDVQVKGGTETKSRTRCFIKASLEDNPYYYNDGEYEANLRTLPKYMQRWYIDGDWSGSADGFFAGIVQPEIHFIDSHDVPPGAEVGVGIDWGDGRHPACAEWAYRDGNGRLVFFDELYGPGHTGRVWGAKMHEKHRDQKWNKEKRWNPEDITCVIDPSASWTRSKASRGLDSVSIPAAIASFGFRVWPANNDRLIGWRQLCERFAIGEDGKAHLYVMRDRCPNLVQFFKRIMPDPKKPGDVDTNMNDHAGDACRYLAMNWPFTYTKASLDEFEEVAMWQRLHERETDRPDDEMSTGYGD